MVVFLLCSVFRECVFLSACADPSGGGGGGARDPDPPPLKDHKNIGQYWSGSPENHKATKPAFNVGTSSARQQNAILKSFR